MFTYGKCLIRRVVTLEIILWRTYLLRGPIVDFCLLAWFDTLSLFVYLYEYVELTFSCWINQVSIFT